MIPSITERDIEAATDVLRSGMLIQGRHVMSLEQKISSMTNTRHAIAVSNGTATMHLVLVALGIGPGDEVIVPAFSYVATANVVELTGARCVFADIDLRTFNIDVKKVEALITPRTKAIIPVHEFGLACDITALTEIAGRHRLHVIEDAACALGACENGRPVGSFGIAGSFSLHPRKSVTSGEGGVITTNDAELARKLSILRNHGIEYVDGSMDFVAAGFNYRMTDFQAAFVNSQLERFETILERKEKIAEAYFGSLDGKRLKLPHVPANKNHTWQTFHLLLDEDLDRASVMAALKQAGIGSNYGAQCIPATTYYRAKYAHDAEREFPAAYAAYTRGLAVPMYDSLTTEEVQYISKHINKFTGNA